MKDTLIIVSTRNRADLTGITLDSVWRNKSAYADVVVLDDASTEYDKTWLERWGFKVARRQVVVGVGNAAKSRYLSFLASPGTYRYACMLDNDLMLSRDFDLKLKELWNRTASLHVMPTLLTGYRSVTQKIKSPGYSWLEASNLGGACQFVDRRNALQLVIAMPQGDWPHNWDAKISTLCGKIFMPVNSLVQHLGVHGSGVNGVSSDTAFNWSP